MHKYIKRMFYRTNGELLNPLYHIFFWITLTMGLTFAFFPFSSGAVLSILYQQTQLNLPDFITSVWGLILVVISILNVLMLWFRTRGLGQVVGLSGACAWLYACIIYVFAHYWFGLLTLSLPNLAFWVYYYFKVSEYNLTGPHDI